MHKTNQFGILNVSLNLKYEELHVHEVLRNVLSIYLCTIVIGHTNNKIYYTSNP